MDIRWTANKEEAQALAAQGFEPIECSFADQSVLGALAMDHHGRMSHLEGVAIRAYRDQFGARRDDPRFVVTGTADADATFAIAALAGLLPHPSRATELEAAPAAVRTALTRDLTGLADLITRVDVAPIGIDLAQEEWGPWLLLWNVLSAPAQDALAFYGGVDRWRALLKGRPLDPLLAAVREQEADRRRLARNAAASAERISEAVVLLVEPPVWGFDVWYDELAPVVLLLSSGGQVTVGCRDVATAERLFGPGGLNTVYPRLEPAGWGGREAVGGGPRGLSLTLDQARAAARQIAAAIRVSATGQGAAS